MDMKLKIVITIAAFIAVGVGLALAGLVDTPRASAVAPEPANGCKVERAEKQNLGSKLVVFGGPVRPMVEIMRVPSPLGSAASVSASNGPEFDPKVHTLRPGNIYHIWAQMTNYGGIDQVRYLSLRRVHEDMHAGNSGPDFSKDDAGIATTVYEYKTDYSVTKHTLGEPGWSSPRGPILLATGESKTFLLSFMLGESMSEGNWQLNVVLE
jgi:hypothetical protein